MKHLTREDAEAIAVKLRGVRDARAPKHEVVRFYYNGKLILGFGIRRGSGEQWHGFIPNQMKLSQMECRLFRKCDISLEEYIEILKLKQVILD